MFCCNYNSKALFSLQYIQQIGIRADFLEGLVRLRDPKHNLQTPVRLREPKHNLQILFI
jgi:hypothetical protein